MANDTLVCCGRIAIFVVALFCAGAIFLLATRSSCLLAHSHPRKVTPYNWVPVNDTHLPWNVTEFDAKYGFSAPTEAERAEWERSSNHSILIPVSLPPRRSPFDPARLNPAVRLPTVRPNRPPTKPTRPPAALPSDVTAWLEDAIEGRIDGVDRVLTKQKRAELREELQHKYNHFIPLYAQSTNGYTRSTESTSVALANPIPPWNRPAPCAPTTNTSKRWLVA